MSRNRSSKINSNSAKIQSTKEYTYTCKLYPSLDKLFYIDSMRFLLYFRSYNGIQNSERAERAKHVEPRINFMRRNNNPRGQ